MKYRKKIVPGYRTVIYGTEKGNNILVLYYYFIIIIFFLNGDFYSSFSNTTFQNTDVRTMILHTTVQVRISWYDYVFQ